MSRIPGYNDQPTAAPAGLPLHSRVPAFTNFKSAAYTALTIGEMMKPSDLISEREASELAKVSIETLSRFVEAGCLSARDEDDGKRYFERSELTSLFGSPQAIAPATASVRTQESVAEVSEPVRMPSQARREPMRDEAPQEESEDQISALLDSDHELIENTEQSDRVSFLHRHLIKLSSMVRMQEQLLELKNREIEDLKGQREWLQARVEKLEEQSDKDKILLLSEAQTIKQLVVMGGDRKRSPWRVVLDYLKPSRPDGRSQRAIATEEESVTVKFSPRETVKPDEDEAA